MKTAKHKPVGNIIGTSQHEWLTNSKPILGIIIFSGLGTQRSTVLTVRYLGGSSISVDTTLVPPFK